MHSKLCCHGNKDAVFFYINSNIHPFHDQFYKEMLILYLVIDIN